MSGLMGGGAKFPSAKDLAPILNLQTGANIKTAAAQTGLNAINQTTPYGNLTYKQAGTWSDGTPRFTSTMSLSPAEQQLLAGQQGAQKSLLGVAGQEASGLRDELGTPLDLSDPSIGSAIESRYMPRLDAQWQKNYETTQSDLANRGIRLGSDAYDRAMQEFQQGKNDAYNQMMIGARGQTVNEMVTQRNQPINEISALMGGSQVQNPQFGQTPQTGISSTDITGTANNIYNQNVQNQNATMGGLFGLGSAAIGGWAMSDERLKEDKEKVGELKDGTNIYKFKFKGGGLSKLGVMAQEIEKKHPEAVKKTPSGFKAVNYSRVADRAAA